MNKLSSSPSHVGVRERISNPRTWSAKLKALGATVGASVLAACALNPAYQSSTGPEQDAGGRRDAGADAGEADAGEDVAVDSGEDATDAGSDVSGGDAAADVGEDATPPEPEFCVSEPDGDLIRCGKRDLCPGQPTDPDEDSDKDGCSDAVDNCNGNNNTNADSDGDGMGDGIVIGPDGVVIACDPYPDCNPEADGALPDAEGRFPPQEIWCDRDDDGDGVPNQEDCFVLDPSRDCGDREAGVREWLRKQIERLFRGRGNSVPPTSRLA